MQGCTRRQLHPKPLMPQRTMKSRVPRRVTARSFLESMARPKSASRSSIVSEAEMHSRFSGLMSRWMTPCGGGSVCK